MTPEIIVAGIAFLGAVLGGGHLVNAIASRQRTRSEARTKAAEGEVAQSKEAREWADDYRTELTALRGRYDRQQLIVFACDGGVPCPARPKLLADTLSTPSVTPVKAEEGGGKP